MAANRSSRSRGTRSTGSPNQPGKNRGTRDRTSTGRPNQPGQRRRPYSGNPASGSSKKSSSIMRKSTWDRLTGREKMQYGTLSYKKYKADMEAMKAKNNRPQRGGGEGRGKGGGPDG